MISLVEAYNYRCLRYIRQPLRSFQVLAGPNASGKTTFLDTFEFLSDLLLYGPADAVLRRSAECRELFWARQGDHFELALEFSIPEKRRKKLEKQQFTHCRYEVSIGLSEHKEEISILSEKLILKPSPPCESRQLEMFPQPLPFVKEGIMSAAGERGKKTIVNKVPGGNDNYYGEIGRKWDLSFKLGPLKSSLANLPDDESQFPVATWVKQILLNGIQTLTLNSIRMKYPSPPGLPRAFEPDGSNMPWVVRNLEKSHPEKKKEWIAHLRTALPDLEDVSTVIREEDKKCYLKLHYSNGLNLPSWLVSDGTLRMLALTLLAYIPDVEGIYLIEEPENGIHPKALEAVFQSLSSVYNAQVLMATHSPVLLGIAPPEDILCFAKTDEGVTDIVSGDQHPALKGWQGEINLGILFAGGVLG